MKNDFSLTENKITQHGTGNIAVQDNKNSTVNINWINQPNLKDIRIDVKRLFETLKEQYQSRYDSKLDGRFEITLEVSDVINNKNFQLITQKNNSNGMKGIAIEVIREVFERHGRLLIVGNPGVGKTVLLLKLGIELLEKITDPDKEPFPVIFNLASWSESYENFGDWLSSILVAGYGLPKYLAEELLQQRRIIFLLDGLDELSRNEHKEFASANRAKCLASLNEYLRDKRKTVISCRIEEFNQMAQITGQKAPVPAKVEVLDLSKAQVLLALEQAGVDKDMKHHASANKLLEIFENQEYSSLLEVLRTPFYFTTAMEIFDQEDLIYTHIPKTNVNFKQFLIYKFLERKLKESKKFPSKKTISWIKWLAQILENEQKVMIELSDLKTNYLKKQWLMYVSNSYLLWISATLILGSEIGFVIGMIFALIYFLLVISLYRNEGEIVDFQNIEMSELFSRQNWKDISMLGKIMLYPIVAIFGIVLFPLKILVTSIKKLNKFTPIKNPYQRLSKGIVRRILIVSLIITTPLILINATYSFESIKNNFMQNGIVILLILVFSLIFTPLIQHLVLRVCLSFEGKMPLKYVTFLNYATETRILEKDGGHWRFRHQNLQEYFVNLNAETDK